MVGPSVLLDTNVWRALVDTDKVNELRRISRQNHVAVVACPAVVYEMLRTPDSRYRRPLIEAATRQVWQRPMTEIYSLAEELRAEIVRLRPDWMADRPDLRDWNRLRADWCGGGWWKRARDAPDDEARQVGLLGDARLARARLDSSARAQSFREARLTEHNLDIHTTSTYAAVLPTRPEDRVESWRVQWCARWWQGLFTPASTSPFRQWLGPWLNLRQVWGDERGFHQFWLYEADRDRLRKHWVWESFTLLQATRKTTSGTPVDAQIASYLTECDFFATGDQVFALLVRRLRAEVSWPLAEAYPLSGGYTKTADELLALIPLLRR